MLVRSRGDDLLRTRGILNLKGEERPLVVHGVQHVFHAPVLLRAWPPGDDRHSRLVVIVRDLSREETLIGLQAFEEAAAQAMYWIPYRRRALIQQPLSI